MAKVRLELTDETFDRLMRAAVSERRPVDWQAEVLLERALGIRPSEARGGAKPTPQAVDAEKHAKEAVSAVA
jgi:hypothetical protein